MKGALNRLRHPAVRAVCFLAFPLFIAATVMTGAGLAQQLPAGLTPDQLQQLQQLQQQSRQPASAVPGDLPVNMLVQPDVAVAPQPPSRLEQIMSQRAGTQLRLFGYDVLGYGRPVTVSQSGGVQDDYVLGPGDEIVVSFRGQEISDSRVPVNRDGTVVLPRLNPIPAAGRTFGNFRQDVQAAVGRAYVATQAFVSLGRVRQVGILVSGEVNNPGQRILPGLGTVIDAILLSGGIKKTGSLRNVRIERKGRQYVVDLYSVLSGRAAGTADLRLTDGDRVVVPLLGPTVAISGLVRQPAIYELQAGQKSISAANLIAQAGGEEVRGLYRLSVLRVAADGRTELMNLRDENAQIADSEILAVQFGADQTASSATLAGGTGLAGAFPIIQGTMLSERLKAPGALGPNPYTLLGIISRRDPRTLLRTLTAFTPVAVLAGQEDQMLQPDDIVRPISVDEMRLLRATVNAFDERRQAELEVIRNPIAATGPVAAATSGTTITNVAGQQVAGPAGGGQPQPGGSNGAGALAGQAAVPRATGPQVTLGETLLSTANTAASSEAANRRDLQSLANETAAGRNNIPEEAARNFQQENVPAGGYAANREATTFIQLAQQLNVDPLVLTNFLIDHQVTLSGALRGPGRYFVGPNTVLQDLLAAAGGLLSWADTSAVELFSTSVDPASGRSVTQLNRLPLNGQLLANYVVKARDEFRFNQVFNDADLGTVTVQGEVKFAGSYRLTRGERLSDLLARAGGLTSAAYPFGTVFLRKSAAVREQEGYGRAADEVQDQILVAMTRQGSNKLDPATFTALQSFVVDLRNQKALGRIAVQADPSILAARPGLDPMLELGDVIYIPPRPSTVSVFGQVMQPGSFPYEANLTVGDYIQRAGGYARNADDGETFIVLPDGTARKVEKSWLRFSSTSLPPGSSIVVPRDITPFDLRQTIVDFSQIFSQLAVSAASLAVLSKQ